MIKKYQKMFSLENKTAIITGGYGHLGSSISKGLAAFGANVIIIGRNEEKLKKFVSENQKTFNNKFEYKVCDVTQEKKFKTIVEKVYKKYGSIDVLINNAYEKQNEDFQEMTKSEWDHAIEYTLTHYVTCSRAVSSKMLKQKQGSIINTASLYAYLGVDHRIFLDLGNNPPIHYAVSKGGVLQLTRYLATLWADKGIRVNSISPGYFPKKRPGVPERLDYIDEINKRTPMGRIGQPDELIGAVVFLASDASSFVTGHNLKVDGGWSIW